jgi:hypothetical protein
MNISKKLVLAAIAAFVCLTSYAQSTGGSAATSSATTANPALQPLPPAIKAQIAQLRAEAGALRTLAADLRAELKGKTPDEQKAIIQQFRQDNAAVLDAQRTLAREIRNELKLLRQERMSST